MKNILSEKEQLGVAKFIERLSRKFGDNLALVKIYGSKARGDWRRNSDIDLLVVADYSDKSKLKNDVYEIMDEVEEEFDHSFDLSPAIYRLREYQKYSNPPTSFLYLVNLEGKDLWKNKDFFPPAKTR